MKTYKSPCVEVLGAVADATAAEYPHGVGVAASTDRQHLCVDLQIRLSDGRGATAHMVTLDQIDEVIRDLLAAKADLLKLMRNRA